MFTLLFLLLKILKEKDRSIFLKKICDKFKFQSIFLNSDFGAPQIGQMSGASFSTVFPQKLQT